MKAGILWMFVCALSVASPPLAVPDDYPTIQDAIQAAVDENTVLVAPGEYVITAPITFQGKTITVRGEAGAAATTIRMAAQPVDPTRASVVIFEDGETEDSVLEGFTLTGGKGTKWGDFPGAEGGGGILCCTGCSGTIVDCVITANATQGRGGGVHCGLMSPGLILRGCTISANSGAFWCGGVDCEGAPVTMTDCTVSDNDGSGVSSSDPGPTGAQLTGCTITGNSGKGISLGESSRSVLTDCTISRNGGGGVYFGDCGPTLTGCVISGNTGVGLDCKESSPDITGCTITGNGGHGVYCREGGPHLTNCTIVENRGGGVYCCPSEDNDPDLLNCIVWGNAGDSIWFDVQSTTVATYSCIEWDPVFPGQGNMNADPMFCRQGHWENNGTPDDAQDDVWTAGDYRLSPGSPCIGTGQDGTTIGAETGVCTSMQFMRGDTNADGGTNIADAIFILSYLFAAGPTPSCLDASDANDDGTSNLADGVFILQNLFASGPAIPPPYADCGIDPTADELGCLEFRPCE